MRSLWRKLALQWLRGEGSEALTEGSDILEGLLREGHARPMRIFGEAILSDRRHGFRCVGGTQEMREVEVSG